MLDGINILLIANSKERDPTEGLAIIVSIVALILTILSWAIIYWLNVKALNLDRKNNFQLEIYQSILAKSNSLIQTISSYTTDMSSHSTSMAKLLNENQHYVGKPESQKLIDLKYKLQIRWLDSSLELANNAYKMQKEIEDFIRFLDMNGTDHTRGTVVYDSLEKLKAEAYKAIERNNRRWSDHKDIDKFTVESFDKLAKKTYADSELVFEFGMCIDDVLNLLYNKSISQILGKPLKTTEIVDKRRYVTESGIIDNRSKTA